MEKSAYKPIEAAKMIGLTKESLLDYERDGVIPNARRDDNGNRYYTPEDIDTIREIAGVRPPLESPPLVLAVFNMKGGVGKSTVSANVAWRISEEGFRTLAVDADPQGHMTTALGEEPSEFQATLQQVLIPDLARQTARVWEVTKRISPNLDLVPGNLSMCTLNLLLFQQPEREYRLRRVVKEIKDEGAYDLIVIDAAPSYDLTSLNILLACDFLIAPVRLDGNSFYGLEYLFDTVRDLGATYRYQIPRVLIVPNHYNQTYSVSRQILEGLQENYAPYLSETVIRQDVNFDKANALREPIFSVAPSSKGSRDLEQLTRELTSVILEHHSIREMKSCQETSPITPSS